MKDVSYDILDLMEEYGTDPAGLRRILDSQTAPEILMALSPIRENLVEWMEIKDTDKVLQLGSGYGAVTGALARKAGEVLVLDPRVENLEVNRLRHQDMTNIRYREGEDKDLTGQSFDWVFLIGPETNEAVFGISRAKDNWDRQEEQRITVIEKIRKAAELTRPGGRMVLAFPNTHSMRVWSGDKPDTEELTVALSELNTILDSLKGKGYKRYYPLPDYKLPSMIYSDAYPPAKGEIPAMFAAYEKPRHRLFSEDAAYSALCEAGGFAQFANSFLVVWEKEHHETDTIC